MGEYKSKVYIKTDNRNRIIRCEGGYTMANIDNLAEWIYIDEGEGDRFNLCQSHYFDKPLYDEHGIPVYKYENGECVERTKEEIEEDILNMPLPIPSQTERIEAQILYTALMTDTLLEE